MCVFTALAVMMGLLGLIIIAVEGYGDYIK